MIATWRLNAGGAQRPAFVFVAPQASHEVIDAELNPWSG
jgi:hypothetical protein